jgi:single stranded DNA-binding protein
MRKITVSGRLGGNPEEKMTQKGVKYVTFRMANSEISEKDKTYWYRITIWDATSQKFALNNFKTGTHVIVYGDYTDSVYQSKQTGQFEVGREIIARDVIFAPGGSAKSEDENGGVQPQVVNVQPQVAQPVINAYVPSNAGMSMQQTMPTQSDVMVSDDELPF